MEVNVISKRRVWDKFFKIDELQLSYQKFNGGMTGPITRLVFQRGDTVAPALFNPATKRLASPANSGRRVTKKVPAG